MPVKDQNIQVGSIYEDTNKMYGNFGSRVKVEKVSSGRVQLLWLNGSYAGSKLEFDAISIKGFKERFKLVKQDVKLVRSKSRLEDLIL